MSQEESGKLSNVVRIRNLRTSRVVGTKGTVDAKLLDTLPADATLDESRQFLMERERRHELDATVARIVETHEKAFRSPGSLVHIQKTILQMQSRAHIESLLEYAMPAGLADKEAANRPHSSKNTQGLNRIIAAAMLYLEPIDAAAKGMELKLETELADRKEEVAAKRNNIRDFPLRRLINAAHDFAVDDWTWHIDDGSLAIFIAMVLEYLDRRKLR